MLGNDFHGPAHFHASGRLPFPHQCPPVLSLERPGDRGKSGRELVDPRADGLRARRVQPKSHHIADLTPKAAKSTRCDPETVETVEKLLKPLEGGAGEDFQRGGVRSSEVLFLFCTSTFFLGLLSGHPA
jgi:hypothetical protein